VETKFPETCKVRKDCRGHSMPVPLRRKSEKILEAES
jgi:hypothetical protein